MQLQSDTHSKGRSSGADVISLSYRVDR